MNRNRLGDELGETKKYTGNELFYDEDCSYRIIFRGICELSAFGSPGTIEKLFSARQLVTCSLNDICIIIYYCLSIN
jgi:hypothetical protein